MLFYEQRGNTYIKGYTDYNNNIVSYKIITKEEFEANVRM